MATTNHSGQERNGTPDKRTRKACQGCMVVVPKGGGTGLFDVYSAKNGENTIYVVDLREERCTCPDHRHRDVECKHIRRVKLGLGIMPVPTGVELDGALEHDREKYGVDPEPVMTDGGQTFTTHVEPPEQGGKEYVRCTGCGRELLTDLGGRDKLPHAEDCVVAR